MTVWTGQWVADRLSAQLVSDSATLELKSLVGMAVRRNPRRAHLLVSTVLGKHVPTDPRIVYGAGRLLGAMVGDVLGGSDSGITKEGARLLGEALAGAQAAGGELLCLCDRHPGDRPAVVLGYAETATGLGHAVADSLGAVYMHSTRRPVPGVARVAGFEEEHSHATSHLLLPEDPQLLRRGEPLVLVDDELSTGRTVLNTIRALHSSGRDRYVVATLVDLRSAADRERMDAAAHELGVQIDVVSLAAGHVELPADVLERGIALVDQYDRRTPTATSAGRSCPVRFRWPVGVRDGGRHGFDPAQRPALEQAAASCADELASAVGERVLVLGFEELMYAPLRIAVALADRLEARGSKVLYSTTTRSPVLAIDDPGYAIRTRLEFAAHDNPADGPGARYAYNVAAGADRNRRFTDIVLVVDDQAQGHALADGLAMQLLGVTDRVHTVVIPAYQPGPRA